MSAWSQLEQLLTCAICLDRFRNPKLLPCQHTFCGEPCMEGLVDYARRQIKCPECRAEHRIPYNGVQSFPNNVTLSRFLDLHRGITGEEPEPLPSQMDRCGVCGEKSVCVRCAHCDKKVCDECRTAHLDILRREINRINTQIRRGLGKLTEHAQQAGKGSERLLLVSTQIRDEISEAVRRFVKDLKDREAKLLADLDEFTESEAKNSEKLTDDLDVELKTISSNCELVEQHMTEMDDWSDVELMEYKEIFLKTLDFLRNMDSDLLDFSRKIKYIQKVDLDNLRRNTADFGEIKITPPLSSFLPGGGVGGGALSPSDSSSNLAVPGSNLMRSQSDHRLAAQFANSRSKDPIQRSYLDVTGQSRYGGGINSDSERERGSSPPGRRGERFGSVRSYGSRTDNFGYTRGWERPGDSDYEPSNSSNFRSRFMRERIRERGGGGGDDHSFEDHDSDVGSNHRVRFQEEASQPRSKLFDTEEMANLRAPLSGIIKLSDSPHVMERLHQNEAKAKQKVAESKENDSSNGSSTMMSTPAPAPILPSRPSRQISEDEIEKQKKQNQAAAAATTAAATATSSPNQTSTQQSSGNNTTLPQTVSNKSNSNSRSSSLAAAENQQTTCNTTSSSANVPANRRVQALQKEDTRSVRSANSDDGATSSPESGDVTCDDETVSVANSTATNPAASALLNTANRRRIFASNGSSGTNASSQQSASVDFGAASPETAGIGRSNVSSSSSRTNQLQTANASPNSYYTSSYGNSSARSSLSRFGTEESAPSKTGTSSGSSYYSKNRKTSRGEDSSTYGSDANANLYAFGGNSSSSYGGIRRPSLSRTSTLDDDDAEVVAGSSYDGVRSYYNSARKQYQQQQAALAAFNAQSSYDRHGSGGSGGGSSSYLRQKLAKSRSSHAIALEDSDDDNNSNNNVFNSSNPLSPTSSNIRSRFGFSGSSSSATTAASAVASVAADTSERFSSSASSSRRTSRSGYTYRTRDVSPDDDAAGSVTQYLINKYGTRSSSNRPSMLSKSKSSHAIYGRSLSSSDEDAVPITPTRRASRDSDSFAYKSAPSYGLTFPRQMYAQKKRMMMKIGSRGTNPGCFTWPRGVACAPDNRIVVADSSNHRVQVFDSTGRFQFEFGSYGSGEGEFDCLAGVTVNRIGHFIVSDRYNHRIQVFDATGRFLRAFGSEGRSDGKFSYPWGIATDALGFIYVCDKENHRDGTFVGKFGSIGSRSGMLEHPHYIAVSNTNRIVVSDSNNHRIQVFDINGRSLTTFGQEGSAEGQFKFPRGVAVDENGFIIVGDSGNNRITILSPEGSFVKSFGVWGSGDGEFKGLEGVAISSTGNILVCDRENHRIQIF